MMETPDVHWKYVEASILNSLTASGIVDEKKREKILQPLRYTVATLISCAMEQAYRDGLSAGVIYEEAKSRWYRARKSTKTGHKMRQDKTVFPEPRLPDFPYPPTYYEE